LSRFLQKGKKRAKNKTSPSYPLAAMLETVCYGPCNFESNIQEKDAPSKVVQRERKKEIGDCGFSR